MSRQCSGSSKQCKCGGASLLAPISLVLFLAIASLALAEPSSAGEVPTLAGVALGTPVQNAIKKLGTPGLVATTDDGHEWRWFDADGLDVDLLADDSLVVQQILAARPQPIHGIPAKLVQPPEFPVLEEKASSASAYMKSIGAQSLVEPETTVSAWHVGLDVVVLELHDGTVRRIRLLDAASAAHLGYVPGPQAPRYRAPRLLGQYPVDYPRRAIERRAEGVVVVEVELAASGSVRNVRVLVSSGDSDIDAAETLSMRRSKFQPARCDDQPCDAIFLDREEYTLAP